MRINRLELIKQLNARIDALSQAAEEKYERETQAEADREYAHWEKTLDAWREFSRTIWKKVDGQGVAITLEDVPEALRDGYHGGGIGLFRRKEVKREQPAIGELVRLVKLLEACPDETVSLASLERAGFVLGRVLK